MRDSPHLLLVHLPYEERLILFFEVELIVRFNFAVELLEEVAALVIIFFQRVHCKLRCVEAAAVWLDLDRSRQVTHVHDVARHID